MSKKDSPQRFPPPDADWRTFVLALHQEAEATAAAKGLTGALAQLAALRETASLASGPAGRAVGEGEVMRILLDDRRLRKATFRAEGPAADGKDPSGAVKLHESSRLPHGKGAPTALRPRLRTLVATVR